MNEFKGFNHTVIDKHLKANLNWKNQKIVAKVVHKTFSFFKNLNSSYKKTQNSQFKDTKLLKLKAVYNKCNNLAFVNMIIRMHWLFASQRAPHYLNSSVADDFIDIHIGLSSRPSLPHHQREVII